MAAHAARQATEGESVLGPSARALLAAAGRAAAELLDRAGAASLAARAAAPHGGLFMRRLFSDQLAALHILKMRLDAGAVANLDRALALDLEPIAACRLAESAARQGDRFRRGLASLEKFDKGPTGRPGRTHTYWISPKSLDEAEARNAMDVPLSDLAPAAGAGQGPRCHADPGLRRGRLNNGNPSGDFLKSPRCGARARSGCPCRQPAMASPRGGGGRCRFHGGKSTGPRTADGLARSRAARLVHGGYSAEIIDLRKEAARRVLGLRALLAIHNSLPPAGHGVDRHDIVAAARLAEPALAIAGRDGYEPARNCNPHAGCAAGRGEIPAVAPVFRAPNRGREPMPAAA